MRGRLQSAIYLHVYTPMNYAAGRRLRGLYKILNNALHMCPPLRTFRKKHWLLSPPQEPLIKSPLPAPALSRHLSFLPEITKGSRHLEFRHLNLSWEALFHLAKAPHSANTQPSFSAVIAPENAFRELS